MKLTNYEKTRFNEIKPACNIRASQQRDRLIGQRINGEIFNNKRAGYGKRIVVTLSQQLSRSRFEAA